MCVNPITIKNPKKDFDKYRDQLWLKVPCGHCCQCVEAKRMEWFTRAYYEYVYTQKCGGSVLYVTLTYNNNHLPKVNNIPVFSKRDIQLFFKRFRKRFGFPNIKYILTSEYGGKTHRPHYHALIYVPSPVSGLTLKKNVRECWPNGFVNFGKYGGLVVGAGAIRYTTKYISKDIDFDWNNDDLVEGRPFHLQSMGFGKYIMDKFDFWHPEKVSVFNILKDGKISVPSTKDKMMSVTIPMYIKRKVTHDFVYDEREDSFRFVENEIGLALRQANIQNKIKETHEHFMLLFNNINTIIYDPERLEMFNRMLNTHFKSSVDVRFRLEGFDWQKVAVYAHLYYNRVSLPLGVVCDIDVPYLSLYSADSIQYQIDYLFHRNKVSTPFPCPKDNPFEFEELRSELYNWLCPDEDFALHMFDALSVLLGQYLQSEYDKKEKEYSNLKSFVE